MKENFDYTHPRQRARFDMLDVASESKKSLEACSNIGLHIERRHPRIEGGDNYNGYMQARKYIDRHLLECGHPKDRDYQGANDYCMRIAKRNTRHRVGSSDL